MTQPEVAFTVAYPEAAGTLATSTLSSSATLIDSIQQHIQSLLAHSQPHCHPSFVQQSSLSAVFKSLTSQGVDFAACAIENSEVGSFRTVYERIVKHSAVIVGEFALRSVIAISDPESGSVSDDNQSQSKIEQSVWTRFVLVSLNSQPLPQSFVPRAALKASVVLSLSHEAGSVFRILSCFAMRNVNVLKFEMRAATPSSFLLPSRSPYTGHPQPRSNPSSAQHSPQLTAAATTSPFLSSNAPAQWHYLFYVDYALSRDERVNAALLAALKEFSVEMILVGIYEQNLHGSENSGAVHQTLAAYC